MRQLVRVALKAAAAVAEWTLSGCQHGKLSATSDAGKHVRAAEFANSNGLQDCDELVAMKDDIENGDKLKFRMVV